MTTDLLTTDELVSAFDRHDNRDAVIAWRLALDATGSDLEARRLLFEAQEHASALADDPMFRRAVTRIADALLTAGHLSGPTVQALYRGDDDDGE